MLRTLMAERLFPNYWWHRVMLWSSAESTECGQNSSGDRSSCLTNRHLLHFGPRDGFMSEAFHVDCLLPTVKHRVGSVIVWGAISWGGMGPLVVPHRKITAQQYLSILGDHLDPMFQTVFPGKRLFFQDDNAPHLHRCVRPGWVRWSRGWSGTSRLASSVPWS